MSIPFDKLIVFICNNFQDAGFYATSMIRKFI
jgi:hypothetical protein